MRSPSSRAEVACRFKGMSEFELDIPLRAGQGQAVGQDGGLTGVPELRVADFGTRRRHSFLWQDNVVIGAEHRAGRAFHRDFEYYLAYRAQPGKRWGLMP